MGRIDQWAIWSGFLRPSSPHEKTAGALRPIHENFLRTSLPLIVGLEFGSFGFQTFNIYHHPQRRVLLTAAFVISLARLVIAPVSMKLMNIIQDSKTTEGDRMKVLARWQSLDLWRLFLSDIPATVLLAYSVSLSMIECQ